MSGDSKKVLDEEDGLDIGFSDDPAAALAAVTPEPAEPNPNPEPAPQSEPGDTPAPTEGAPADPPQADPAPNADDKLLQQVKNLIDGRLRNHTGDIGKMLDKRLKEMAPAAAAAAATAKADGAAAPSNQQISDALKSGEKFKKLAEDFPEWGEAFLEMQGIAAASLEASLVDKILAKVPKSEVTLDAVTKGHMASVTAAHRTWKKDINSPQFATWLDTQDASTKALAESDDPEEAIDLLDRYYAAQKPAAPAPQAPPANQQRLEAAAVPAKSGSGRQPPKGMTEEDGLMEGFNA